MGHTFAILELEGVTVKNFVLAYSANHCQYFSHVPESTISIYADFVGCSDELWDGFISKMRFKPFRNVFVLGMTGSELYNFYVKEEFRDIGDVEIPVKRLPAYQTSNEKVRLLIMIKALS